VFKILKKVKFFTARQKRVSKKNVEPPPPYWLQSFTPMSVYRCKYTVA